MSFTNAPITKSLCIGLVAASVTVSVLDAKHYFYVLIEPHFWKYGQLWRALVFQLCYTNSSECLFGVMTIYNMRVIERMWGSRKYASFLMVSWALTSMTMPIIMSLILKPLAGDFFNYIPAGPTPVIFAVMANYYAMVPHMYQYRISVDAADETTSENTSGDESGLTFSDKSYRYLLSLQLALFQLPGSIVGATFGWAIASLWRNGFIPTAVLQWRVPAWLVGLRVQKGGRDYGNMRRRLENEGAASATTSGRDVGDEGRRRTMAQQVAEGLR